MENSSELVTKLSFDRWPKIVKTLNRTAYQ